MIKKKNIRKVHFIFITLITVEALIVIFSFLFLSDCGSPCDTHSILDPFGKKLPTTGTPCLTVCIWRPGRFFYPPLNILLLTIFVYITFILISKIKYKNT